MPQPTKRLKEQRQTTIIHANVSDVQRSAAGGPRADGPWEGGGRRMSRHLGCTVIREALLRAVRAELTAKGLDDSDRPSATS